MSRPSLLPQVLTGARWRSFAVLVANGLGQAAVMVGIALLTRFSFDGLGEAGTGRASTSLTALAVGGLAALGLGLLWLRTAERTTSERLGQSYLTATRLRLFDHLNTVPSRVLQTRTRGVMMVRFVADLNALNSWISRGLARLAVSATTALTALLVLAWVSPAVAVGVAAAMAIAAGTVLAVGPALYARVRDLRRARGRLAANLGEKLTAFSPVHVFGRTRGERARLERQSEELAGAAVARTRLSAFLRAMPDAALPIVTGLILVVGLLQPERISAGSLLAAILIANLLASPLRDLAQIFVFWQNYRAARDVLTDFLALPSLSPADGKAPPLRKGPGRLSFCGVTVAGSLQEVDVEAAPRSFIAVTGASGAGKSTLLALAARLFDPDRGTVRIDGEALSCVDLTSVRRAIGMIAPELPLLRGSIRRNLTYRARGASEEEIADILRACALDRVVAALPRGLDTRVHESGANLPAGLRQRLLVARAVLGRPRLVLIDDADALLDEVASDALARVIAQRRATTLMVTAAPHWLRLADEVWHFEDGRLRSNSYGADYVGVARVNRTSRVEVAG